MPNLTQEWRETNLLEAVFDQLSDALIIYGPDRIITGANKGSVNFGGAGLLAPGAGNTVFIARFDPNGNHLCSQIFGDDNDQLGTAIAAAPLDEFAITGALQGTADFGGGLLTGSGSSDDVFAARFKP